MQKLRALSGKINPKLRKYILLVIIIIAIILVGSKILAASKSTPKAVEQISSGTPQKQEDVNKEFVFPVGTVNGTDIKMKFAIQQVSLNNQIVVEGKNATAIKGRTFLIVTIKITNDFNQSLQINTKDYIRLSVNGDENTWLAPDIHNDGDHGVEVQAISTKYTRVGFPVNVSDKNFVLQIGEIKGDKQKVPLNL